MQVTASRLPCNSYIARPTCRQICYTCNGQSSSCVGRSIQGRNRLHICLLYCGERFFTEGRSDQTRGRQEEEYLDDERCMLGKSGFGILGFVSVCCVSVGPISDRPCTSYTRTVIMRLAPWKIG